MRTEIVFICNSILLGVGLAMDAFTVSLANGMHDPHMGVFRRCWIAGTFAFFQFLMPMIGWYCVRTVMETFQAVQPFIPWIALLLLGWIGSKMMIEGIRGEPEEVPGGRNRLSAWMLFVQGIATSIDALSVGFTIASYTGRMALLASVIIAVVTFFLCLGGLRIGRRAGLHLAGRASILGGVILIAIGIEILVKHLG